jgi:hypothetical protein
MVADALPQYQLQIVGATGVDNAIDALPAALAAHNPQLVTIEVGINNLGQKMDSATFLARYVTMLSILKSAHAPRVVACTVPWTTEAPGSEVEAVALRYNAAINFVVPAFGYEVAALGHRGALRLSGHRRLPLTTRTAPLLTPCCVCCRRCLVAGVRVIVLIVCEKSR